MNENPAGRPLRRAHMATDTPEPFFAWFGQIGLINTAFMKTLSTKVRPFLAGNWKMNGLKADLLEVSALVDGLKVRRDLARMAIMPSHTLLAAMADHLKGSDLVELGGQDCHPKTHGAFTGDVSALQLKDAGARLVILGHSERRHGLGESSHLIAQKVQAALDADLEPILCIGETLAEREAGATLAVVLSQLKDSLTDEAGQKVFHVAYEPVWAIGTGLTPTLEQIAEVHLALRQALVARFGPKGETVTLLYGGSVKPDNAGDILTVAHVNGALIGGASLKAKDFLGIFDALAETVGAPT